MSNVFDAYLFASVFITLFVIMDPPGVVPIFLGLTGAMTRQQRNRAARQAVLVALGVIVAFALFGQSLLNYMHITLPALQASGGLLLLLIAMELLTGKMEEPQPSGNSQLPQSQPAWKRSLYFAMSSGRACIGQWAAV